VAARAASQAKVDDGQRTASLLDELHESSEERAARILIGRIGTDGHSCLLDNESVVASLRRLHAEAAITALAGRAIQDEKPDDFFGRLTLLATLERIGEVIRGEVPVRKPVDGTKRVSEDRYIKARIGLSRHVKELRTHIPAAPQDSGDVDVVADLSTAEQGGHLVRDSIILMQHRTNGKSHWGMRAPVDAKLNPHLLSARRPKVDPGEARVSDLDRYFQPRCPVSSDSCIDPLSETARRAKRGEQVNIFRPADKETVGLDGIPTR
jgi:hypothetical protein